MLNDETSRQIMLMSQVVLFIPCVLTREQLTMSRGYRYKGIKLYTSGSCNNSTVKWIDFLQLYTKVNKTGKRTVFSLTEFFIVYKKTR